jgi:hypothetical protein
VKNFIAVLIVFISFGACAFDMSSTEDYKTAYKQLKNGTQEYVGSCSTHQDLENKKFKVTKNLIKYFEPSSLIEPNELNERLKSIDSELIKIVISKLQVDSLKDIDDLTVDQIESFQNKQLDLYRLNIGIGGGNGMYLVFNKVTKNKHVKYELMSEIMDGDVQYCDQLVWTSK